MQQNVPLMAYETRTHPCLSHVFSPDKTHTCPSRLPRNTQRKEETRGKKGISASDWTWLLSFSSFFPWPFYPATSAETSFHSSCCSQLVNSCTLLFFTKRRGKKAGGVGVWVNRQLVQCGSYYFSPFLSPTLALKENFKKTTSK